MEMECLFQRGSSTGKSMLLPMMVLLAGQAPEAPTLAQDKKPYILLFLSYITFFKDFHACQLGRSQASVYPCTAQSPCKTQLPLLTSATAQEIKRLKTDSLPTKNMSLWMGMRYACQAPSLFS